MRKWYVIPGIEDAEMLAVAQDLSEHKTRPIDAHCIVADKLSINDAALIAAAPDMLEAIGKAISRSRRGDRGGFEISIDAYDAIRAAYAKAKGAGDE